jgi:hypothetical protein
MAITHQDLQSFQRYASARLLNGGDQLEIDDLLEEWKHQTPDPDQAQGDMRAVEATLRDMDHGDHGRTADEVIREIIEKYKLTE